MSEILIFQEILEKTAMFYQRISTNASAGVINNDKAVVYDDVGQVISDL